MIQFALLGCGRIGKMHAANLSTHPDAVLSRVYDVHEPSARGVGDRLGVEVAASPEEIFESAEVDAVLVATATETHADYIERAVAAGKPVLCEKPIDLSLARVEECARRIAGSRVPVQLGFNRRFDPGHRGARDSLRAGAIGELHQVIVTSRDPHMPPRAYYEQAGGLFRDMTIHDFDLLRFFLGEEPVEVFATAGRLIDPPLMEELDDHDTAMIFLRTASGVQCHINNSRTAVYGSDQRVELLGTEGMLQSANRRPHEVRLSTATQTEAAAPYEYFFLERYEEAFREEISAFVRAIAGGTPPEVGFEDGHRALLLAETAYRSLREGRMVRVEEVGTVG